MSDRPRPPYATGSVVIPKTQHRWLDVQAQNGALQRVRSYLTVPKVTTTVSWAGYRQIVFAVNFECPNNISLKVVAATTNPLTITKPTMPISSNVILDVNGNPLLDVNGNPISGI